MIKTKSILNAVKNISDVDNMFNLDSEFSQQVTIYSDNRVELNLIVTELMNKGSKRVFYAKIIYKDFKIEKDSNIIINIDKNLNLSQNFDGYGIIDVVKSCFSCNINFLNNLNFTLNGYSLEVAKSSNRYVTILEHVNTVSFKKRYDSIDKLLNYIYYRKNLHSKVEICVDVSTNEIENVERGVLVQKNNANDLYSTIIEGISPSPKESKNISINVLEQLNRRTSFEISYVDEKLTHSMICEISPSMGISFETKNEIIFGSNLKGHLIICDLLNKLNGFSGHFNRYINLILQIRKFEAKLNRTKIKTTKNQLDIDEVSNNIFLTLKNAINSKKMISKRVELTSFKGYKRFVELHGVMKNRRRCDMKIFAQNGEYIFEEYSLKVEKIRVMDNSKDFLEGYFI